MIKHELNSLTQQFKWIDIVDPTPAELHTLADSFNLPSHLLDYCFSPELTPKCENYPDFDHIVIRVHDSDSSPDADTIQELTNKIIFFVSKSYVITIHKYDFAFLELVREKWSAETLPGIKSPFKVVWEIFFETLKTYENPIENALLLVDDYETEVFEGKTNRSLLKELYILKRNSSVYKRMIHLTKEIIFQLEVTTPEREPLVKDLRIYTDKLKFLSDQLQENVNSLLNLHLSLSSHRTNEVMRILTVFSVFFLPLTFIVGVYGMNFEFMPELSWRWGYAFAWGVMTLTTAAILILFSRKGWMK